MKKFKFIFITLIMFLLAFTFSCTTTNSQKIEGLENSSNFMKANVGSISTHTLDNGITVIIKKQPSNRIYSMKVVYKGGVAMLPQGKDGLESLTLATMLRGSKKYTYDDLTKICFEKSSSISSSCNLDSSVINLHTIDKYWSAMFEVFSDLLLNPTFDDKQLELVKINANNAIQKELTDPFDFTVKKLHDKIHAGHPYEMQPRGTKESIASIKTDNLKNWHQNKLTADRMFVVAVGDFNVRKLVADLNKTLGKIPVKDNKIPEVKPLEIKQNIFTEEFSGANGIGYIRGDYVIPSVTEKDFACLQLAYGMLNDLLFSVVRTDHAACYSVWASAHGFKAPYGSLVVFKTDQPSNAKLYFDEAIAILASGKTMNLKAQGMTGGEGNTVKVEGERYAPIAESLASYKSKFVNGFFSGQFTNADIAGQIAGSYNSFGSPYEYLRFIDKINAVTADDILRVTNKYIVDGKISWMVVSDKQSLSKIDKSKFMKFTGTVKK